MNMSNGQNLAAILLALIKKEGTRIICAYDGDAYFIVCIGDEYIQLESADWVRFRFGYKVGNSPLG